MENKTKTVMTLKTPEESEPVTEMISLEEHHKIVGSQVNVLLVTDINLYKTLRTLYSVANNFLAASLRADIISQQDSVQLKQIMGMTEHHMGTLCEKYDGEPLSLDQMRDALIRKAMPSETNIQE